MKPFSLNFILPGFLAFSILCPVQAAAEDGEKEEIKTVLTYVQLRNELMDFADRYMQVIGQAADTLQRLNTDPDKRGGIHSIKLFPSSAAFSIANDTDPQMALLDMVVLVHLQGAVWKDSAAKRFGENAGVLLKAQHHLEEDIDSIADQVLGPRQLEHLKKLVREWHKKHPEQRYVSYIRFTDFAELRRPGGPESRGPNMLSLGGLLSAFQLVNVDEASRSVDQARMVGERALYLAERMPSLLRWQTEMGFYGIASEPEIKSLLKTNESLQSFPERLTGGLLVVVVAAFLLALVFRRLTRPKN